jgi:hypothetical protein
MGKRTFSIAVGDVSPPSRTQRRLEELHDRVRRGAYRPQPSCRVYIPTADGRQRPLAVAAVEDKIVQGAVAMVLSAIYEVNFFGFMGSDGDATSTVRWTLWWSGSTAAK